jgi:hypothetical protein
MRKEPAGTRIITMSTEFVNSDVGGLDMTIQVFVGSSHRLGHPPISTSGVWGTRLSYGSVRERAAIIKSATSPSVIWL